MGCSNSTPSAASDTRARTKKSTIADKVARAGQSGVLNLSESNLKELPPGMLKLALRNLNLSQNALETLPNNFSANFGGLKVLNLSNNRIQFDAGTAQSVFTRLVNLTTLSLDNNVLSQLPVFPAGCKLTKITVSHNKLRNVPEALRNLSNLKEVDLSHNQIQGELPTWLSQLSNLENISLGWNKISSVPAELAALERLLVLQLQSNLLTDFPNEILANSKALNRIQLEGNKITKAQLTSKEGFKSFDTRRQQRINKKIAAGLETDRSICGLD